MLGKFFGAAALVLLLSSSLFAKSVELNSTSNWQLGLGAGFQFTTLAAAIADTNAAGAGPHTITITDSADYTNAGVIDVLQDLSITASAGQAPFISNTAASGQVLRIGTNGGSLSVIGASSSSRITIRQSGNASQPAVNTGPTVALTKGIRLENVTINRGTTAGNVFVSTNAGNHVLLNVNVLGTCSIPFNFAPSATANFSVTNLNVSGATFSGTVFQTVIPATFTGTLTADGLNVSGLTLAGGLVSMPSNLGTNNVSLSNVTLTGTTFNTAPVALAGTGPVRVALDGFNYSSANSVTLNAQPLFSGVGSLNSSLIVSNLNLNGRTQGTSLIAVAAGSGTTSATLDGLTVSGTTLTTNTPVNVATGAATTNFTLNNVNLSNVTALPFAVAVIASNSTLTYSNSNLSLPVDSALFFGNSGGNNPTVIFTNCSIRTNNTPLIASGLNLGNAYSVTFNNPTFTGACSPTAINMNAGGTVTINGASAASKADLAPIATGGTTDFVKILAGTLNLTDVTNTGSFGSNILISSKNSGALASTVNVNLNRCYFGNNKGIIDLSTNAASSFAVNVTATNTIWNGASGYPQNIGINDSARTVPGSINLTHCSLLGPTGNVLLNANGSDAVVINYSLLDATGTSAVNGSVAPTGNNSMIIANASGTAWFGLQPGNWTVVPNGNRSLVQLDGTGRIGATSIAGAGATGSATTVDIDGNARPNGGTTPDIGASESAAVPVELSGFSAE